MSSSIGIRDVSGLHNNLFGTQADWGAVDVPFRRDIAADFTNYVTSPGADYTPGTSVIDYHAAHHQPHDHDGWRQPAARMASGHYVNWDSARYLTRHRLRGPHR